MEFIKESTRMTSVKYAIRDLVVEAQKVEKEGHEVIKLNIGDPNRFDFTTPQHMVDAVVNVMKKHDAEYYEDSMGLVPAREAIAKEAVQKGIPDITAKDIIIGNGASEVIVLALGALLNQGDNILTPSPGYPLYTAYIPYFGGKMNPYKLDEANNWQPDLNDIESKIDEKTRAIIVINPNNPTGAVYNRETLDGIVAIARKHNLIIFADEIYDKLLFDGQKHIPLASISGEVPVLTFCGLSKNYVAPGWRVGWVIVSDPEKRMESFIEGIRKAARSRLSSVGPFQHAIAPALQGSHQHIDDMIGPNGILTKRREIFHNAINTIPHLSCVKPQGAFYAFVKIDKEVADDQALVIDILKKEKLLVVHGTGFDYPTKDHFRITILPDEKNLEEAMNRLRNYFSAL